MSRYAVCLYKAE